MMPSSRTLIAAVVGLLAVAAHAQASAVEAEAYWSAKALCWADLAKSESSQGDVRGTPAIANGNAERIRAAVSLGQTPDASAEVALYSRKVLPAADLRYGRPKWRSDIESASAVLESYRGKQCRTPVSACLEVALESVWENMEESEGARWNHGRPEIDRAVQLARQAEADQGKECEAPPAAASSSDPAADPVIEKQEVLLADVLFAFDSAVLSASGTKAVGLLAQRLTNTSGSRAWTVTGYTDRFGSDEHNQALSLRRAKAVAAALQELLPQVRVQPLSGGSAFPIVHCPGEFSAATVACLAPNRRVVVRPIE